MLMLRSKENISLALVETCHDNACTSIPATIADGVGIQNAFLDCLSCGNPTDIQNAFQDCLSCGNPTGAHIHLTPCPLESGQEAQSCRFTPQNAVLRRRHLV